MHGDFSFVLGKKTSPDRVTPYPEESLRSVITRFAERTGHESPRVLDTFFEQGALGHSKSDHELTELAEMLGYPLQEVLLRNAAPVHDDRLIFARVSIGGQDLQASYYSRMRRAVSPASLRSAPYHRHYWDIAPLGFCPESLELLIHNCPNSQCGRPLTWGGTSVCHCHRCGYDLRHAKAKKLKAGDKYSLPVLAQLFSLNPNVRAEAQASLPAHLKTLKSTELLTLILFFGGNVSEFPAEQRKRLRVLSASGQRTDKSIELIGNGLIVLKYLDEYIFDVLDMVLSERWKLRQERRHLHELGPFIHFMDPERQEETVRNFIKPYLNLYFNRNYAKLRRKCLGSTLAKWSDKALEIEDAMSEFSISRWDCTRLLQTDYASAGARSGKTERCLDRAATVEYLKQSVRFRRFRDITRDEQVPFEAIANLAKVSGFSPVPPELVGPLKPDSCPRQEWDAFKKSCEANVQPSDEAVCNLRNVVLRSGKKILGWVMLFELLASGDVVLAGIDEKETGIAGRWLVARQKTLDAMGIARVVGNKKSRVIIHKGSTLRPLTRACREIGLNSEKASELVVNGYLEATISPGYFNRYYVDDEALDHFRQRFVAVTELCIAHNLARTQVPAWLRKCGVDPIQGDISPIFFKRLDVQSVIDAGIEKYGHVSDEANAGKVAHLQLYDFPSEWTANDLLERAAAYTVPIRHARFVSLAKMLRGMSPQEAILDSKAHLSTLINEWIPIFRADGVEGRTAQVVGKTRMTKTERANFEAFARNIMVDRRVRRSEITASIQNYVRSNFGVEYHITAITRLLRRAKIEYPKDMRPARAYNDAEVERILDHARVAYNNVRSGELAYSTETVRKWAEEQFNVTVTRSTISRLLRQHGIKAPSVAERSAISRKLKVDDKDKIATKRGPYKKRHQADVTFGNAPGFWDLSDQEWRILKPLLPRSGPYKRADDKTVISGILYILGTGQPWSKFPDRDVPYLTAYNRFQKWKKSGLWQMICDKLRIELPTSRALGALTRINDR